MKKFGILFVIGELAEQIHHLFTNAGIDQSISLPTTTVTLTVQLQIMDQLLHMHGVNYTVQPEEQLLVPLQLLR
jgi:hypothetical protein